MVRCLVVRTSVPYETQLKKEVLDTATLNVEASFSIHFVAVKVKWWIDASNSSGRCRGNWTSLGAFHLFLSTTSGLKWNILALLDRNWIALNLN